MSVLIANTHVLLSSHYATDIVQVRRDIQQRYSVNKITFSAWLSQQIMLEGTEQILDINCGQREQLDALARRVSSGAVYGYDLLHAAVGDKLPFADANFDVVSADHMLYTFCNVSTLLAEIRRVLRPGGVVLMATHARDHLQELTDLHIIAASSAGLPGEALYAARTAQAVTFCFDDGANLLTPFFGNVRLRTQSDSFEFRSATPVIRYYRTTARYADIMRDATIAPDVKAAIPERMRAIVGALIADSDDGVFRVTKKAGVFVARAVAY